MKENEDKNYSLVDVTNTIRSFLGYLRKKWWLMLLAALAGALLGVGYYYNQKPKYEAVTTFILEEKSAGGGGLAGLASQFGLSMGGLGGGSIFAGDNILDILKSKKIVQQVLLSKVDTTAKSSSLADLYLEFTGLKKKWQNSPRSKEINFYGDPQQLSPLQDSVLNVIFENTVSKNITVDRLNKKGSIIKVQVTAADQVFARLMTERLVDAAARLYMDIRTSTSQENIRQLQRRSDSLLMLLNRKSFAAAASQPLDINPGLRTAIVPTEIATRDKTVLATLYGEVIKNLEASKLLLSQQTPVIQLLDKPGKLLENKRMPLLLLTIAAVLFATFACLFVIGLLYLIKTFGSR